MSKKTENEDLPLNPPGINDTFFPLGWNDAVDFHEKEYKNVKCPKCGKITPRYYLPTPETKHYGRVGCSICESFLAWMKKPENILKRPKKSLNLAEKYEINYCEICLRDKSEVPHRTIEGHHIIESSDGGSDERDNILGLCLYCHGVVTNIRHYVGRHSRRLPS